MIKIKIEYSHDYDQDTGSVEIVDGDDGAEQVNLAVGHVDSRSRLRRGAPDESNDILKHENDSKGEEKLESFIPTIDKPEQSPLNNGADKE